MDTYKYTCTCVYIHTCKIHINVQLYYVHIYRYVCPFECVYIKCVGRHRHKDTDTLLCTRALCAYLCVYICAMLHCSEFLKNVEFGKF